MYDVSFASLYFLSYAYPQDKICNGHDKQNNAALKKAHSASGRQKHYQSLQKSANRDLRSFFI